MTLLMQSAQCKAELQVELMELKFNSQFQANVIIRQLTTLFDRYHQDCCPGYWG